VRLPRALVLSVIAHGTALAIGAHECAHDASGGVATVQQPAVAIEVVGAAGGDDIVGIQILTGDDEPIAIPLGTTETVRVRARAAGAGAGAEAPEPEPAPHATGTLAMRGLRHDLSVSPEIAAKLFANDKPYEPETTRPDRFKPNNRDQTFKDSVMTTTVHPDGSVDFKDQKDFQIHFHLPIPRLKAIKRMLREEGEDLADWAANPYAERDRVGRMQDLPNTILAIPGACSTWGDINCDVDVTPRKLRSLDEADDAEVFSFIDGRIDITSWLHRKYIGDPNASRKLAFLDETRDERVRKGTAYRAAQLEKSAEIMRANLEQLWRATSDPAERRAALFALWDECTEGDGEVGAAGERARAMVIGWIGSHLPKGQPGAFTDDEIAAFDSKRSSRQHFAPYAE
jgi:hypothetical protein